MDFTRLRLIGFKSFVDPTDLLIKSGLTGIIGPNGCGKSNLTEALRWVMGETSAKSLRGGGMDDVIFSGTSRRPARSFAEVSLFIDNRDRNAPAQFNEEDELDIIRRITRDMGSAYKVNGKDQRARDVQTLFADAATGAQSPSMVRQGQIGELIDAKPKNRRRILEDAAGIAGLYARRREAELKLNATTDNLLRLDDTLMQLESQLNTLEKQSKQATQYRELSKKLRRDELLIMYISWQEVESQKQALLQNVQTAKAQVAQGQILVQESEKAQDSTRQALTPLREEEAIAQAILQRISLEQNGLQAKQKQALADIKTFEAQVRDYQNDLEREATLHDDAQKVLAHLKDEDATIITEQVGEEDALQDLQQKIKTIKSNVQKYEKDFETANVKYATVQAERDTLERNIKKEEDLQKTRTQELESTKGTLETLEKTLEQKQTDHQSLSKKSVLAQKDVENYAKFLQDAENAYSKASEAEQKSRYALSELEAEYKALSAEEKSMQQLAQKRSGQNNQNAVLFNIDVQPGFEKALGAVFGDQLNYAVVKEGIGWLEKDSNSPNDQVFETITPLINYVKAPSPLHRRLQHIGVIDGEKPTLAQIEQLTPGQVLVNKAGDFWRWDGLHLSAKETSSDASQQLEYKNRLSALQKSLTTLNKKRQTQQGEYAEAQSGLETTKKAYNLARQQLKNADDALVDVTRNLSKSESELTTYQSRCEILKEKHLKLQTELKDLADSLDNNRHSLSKGTDIEKQKEFLSTVKKRLHDELNALNVAQSDLDTLHRRANGRRKRREAIEQECSSWRNRLENATKQTQALKDRLQAAQSNLQKAKQAPEKLDAEKQKLLTQEEQTKQRLEKAKNAFVEAENAFTQAGYALNKAQEALAKARENLVMCETKLDAAKLQATEKREALEAHYQHPVSGILEQLEVSKDEIPAVRDLEESVRTLKRTREQLGGVNLRADIEAQEARKDYEKLKSEKVDLETAVEKLRGGIGRLNREGRQRLLKAFEEVNKNFSMLFRHLFNGGEAHLTLIESDDPLEAGLEIMCMPPGKKLSSLSLLSGGEQTLTALSLIFAVFLANPSPICVLDEVDAPLDDANVNRFCDLLEEMTKRTKTRFLIITHHATTMSRMDRLYGVTMQEHGVSQLVSVDLTTATKMVS